MNEGLTVEIEHDGEHYIAVCREVPAAKGRGRTAEEARATLAEAIKLIRLDSGPGELPGPEPSA